jgi:hypothetical protein
MDRNDAWEYRIVVADMRPGGMDEINALGRDGWEAVTGTPGGNKLTVLMKRRLHAAS